MSANLARTADGWWAVTPAGLVRLDLPAATTAGLLADRTALTAAIEAAQAAAPQDAVPAESLDLLSPVTAPARVVAQAVNYRSHAIDSGFDPDRVPAAFFRKASHSITGPTGDIIRPDGVGFLDYEVELGLVIGADLPAGTTVTDADLARYVAALVVANDVSARQIQLVKTQFYESKSYPTFTPVGPWLTLVDASDLARLDSLRLTLRVNGEVRQDSTAADMIVRPARALTLLSRFQPLAPGDLLLTGTPGGTALKAPAKIAGLLAGLLPPATRWKLFFGRQAANPRYLHDGDVITATIASPTAGSTSARSATPLSGRRHDHARNTHTAAAGLDLPAAAGRRPHLARRHRHPVDPRPGRSHPLPGLDLRRAGRHGDADRQRADRAGGAARGRGDAGQRQHLDAVRRHPGRAGRRDRRPGQPRAVRRADRRADPPDRITGPGRGRAGAGPAAVAAAARGGPPGRDDRRPRAAAGRRTTATRPPWRGDTPPWTRDGRGPVVAYLDEVIAGQPSGHLAGADLPAAGDLAAFVHTGGTTGAPKVAAHTHANQLACARGIAVCSGLAPGEGMLGGLPLFHVNALIVTGIAPMFSGARVVWPGPAGYRDKALYARFWQIIEHYRIAAMSAVPTVYGTLAQVPVDADISSLRLPIVGASPLPASVREAFAAHTGRHLLEGYGLTEATCASTWTRPGEERPGSVGRVLPGQQVKAVRTGDDGSWADCAPGETGVLVIGGPAVFAGYVTDPEAGGPRVSRDGVVRDGWLDTGDLGRVDAGGFVYLTGRAKDLIIRGGHNIDPRVIEDALLRHPAVRAAAAVGRPDRHSGEVPVAYVVPAGPGRFDEADLLAWAGTAIDEPAARPKRIYPITAIPVTEVGKHFKPALTADAAVRAITEALAAAGLPDARATAAHEHGRLVVTVTGADPGRVRDAVAGFALTVRCGPSPAPQTTVN